MLHCRLLLLPEINVRGELVKASDVPECLTENKPEKADQQLALCVEGHMLLVPPLWNCLYVGL